MRRPETAARGVPGSRALSFSSPSSFLAAGPGAPASGRLANPRFAWRGPAPAGTDTGRERCHRRAAAKSAGYARRGVRRARGAPAVGGARLGSPGPGLALVRFACTVHRRAASGARFPAFSSVRGQADELRTRGPLPDASRDRGGRAARAGAGPLGLPGRRHRDRDDAPAEPPGARLGRLPPARPSRRLRDRQHGDVVRSAGAPPRDAGPHRLDRVVHAGRRRHRGEGRRAASASRRC